MLVLDFYTAYDKIWLTKQFIDQPSGPPQYLLLQCSFVRRDNNQIIKMIRAMAAKCSFFNFMMIVVIIFNYFILRPKLYT